MKQLIKAFILSAAVCLLSFGGCYTRIATYQGEVTEAGSSGGGCGDCREEVPYTGNRQVCVWERDFFGYPELRCYYTGYASSWLYFHNTPWWYRSSFGWRDTRGCPPYYYYDGFSGTCRYYGGSYSRPNTGTGGGGGGGGAVAGSERPRPQMRGIKAGDASPAESAPSSAVDGGSGLPPMFSGGANKTLSPAGAPLAPSSPPPAPSSGSDAGMTKPQGGEGKPSNPPPEQRPEEKKPVDKNERPRPSMRGM